MKTWKMMIGGLCLASGSMAFAEPAEPAPQSIVARSEEHVRVIPEEMIPLPFSQQANYRDRLKVTARPGDEVVYQLSPGSAYVLQDIEYKNPSDSQFFTTARPSANPSALSIVVRPDAPQTQVENLLIAKDRAGNIVKIDPLIVIGPPF